FKRADLAFTVPTLCTVRLSRALFPQHKKHNLSALIERYDFKCTHRHRAFDDAKVLWDFLQYLPKEFSTEQIATAISRTIKKIPPKKQQALNLLEVVEELEYV